MAITFVAAGTLGSAGSGNPTVPGLPAGWAAGDIHVLLVSAADNVVVTLPAGWTKKLETNGGTALRQTIAWRRAVGGDTAPTVTHAAGDGVLARIFGFRGCTASGDPIEAIAAQANAATATCTAPAITPLNANAAILFLGCEELTGNTSNSPTWGTFSGTNPTFAQLGGTGDQTGLGVNDISQNVAWGLKTDTTSTGNRTAVITGETPNPTENIGCLLALTPLVTGGGFTHRRPLPWELLKPQQRLGGTGFARLALQRFKAQRLTPLPGAVSATVQVGASSSVSWRVRTLVTASRTCTWRVRAAVGGSRSLTWRLRVAIGASSSVSWRVRSAVGASRALTWRVRAAIGSSRALTWRVRTAVGLSRSTTWRVRALAGSSRSTTWRVRQLVASLRPTTWRVRAPAAASRSQSWRVTTAVGASSSLQWRVKAFVGASRPFTWAVVVPVKIGHSLAFAWFVTGSAQAPGGISRRRRVVVIPAPDRVREPVEVGSAVQLVWQVGCPVGAELVLTWRVLNRTSAVLRTSWRLTDFWTTNRDLLLAEIDEDLLVLTK